MEWITVDDPASEAWRLLKEYANLDFCLLQLSLRHGEPESKSVESNYKKQAQQIRACLLQAEEYFRACATSSIVTSPNHLYYGAVSLAAATMLFNGDGTKSLDFLRRDGRNASHGLSFTIGASSREASSGTQLLEKSFVKVEGGGFFANWYNTIDPRDIHYLTQHTIDGQTATKRTAFRPLGAERALSLKELRGIKWSCLDILRRLPDPVMDLVRFGIDAPCCRASASIRFHAPRGPTVFQIRLLGASTEAHLDAILEHCKTKPSFYELVELKRLDHSAIVTWRSDHRGRVHAHEWPSMRIALHGETYAFAGDPPVREVVDAFAMTFVLSMLSRYHPDLWVVCLDAHCSTSKLVERFTDVYTKKFPMLFLSLLRGSPVFISTQPVSYVQGPDE